jgi:leucyl aminopeptidase
MNYQASQGNIYETAADTLIVNLFADVTEPDGATGALDLVLGGAIREMIANGDLRGKEKEVGVLYPRGAIAAKRVIVIGLGEANALDLEKVRRAMALGARRARELGAKHIATVAHGAGAGHLPLFEAVQATIEGAALGLYHTSQQDKDIPGEIETLTVVELDGQKIGEVQEAVRVASITVEGVYLARDLVNLPPNIATPRYMAEQARQIAAKYGLNITVGDRAWAAERKMGAFLAVAKGAGEEPQFIVLEHNAGRADLDTVVLVGKGITFDSGGISLKPAEKMEEMKSDMAGAAAVMGAMQTAARLNLPLHLVGIMPCTENMPDAHGYHPADVITASNGMTIEIISTDAEGRLILADALVYAQQYQPKAVIDLATLTGACVIALGEHVAAGLFCTDDWLQDRLVASGKTTHERVWPMPLWDDYKRKIASLVADMTNSGGRFGGVGSSAIFLKAFTNYPWAHVDIAGMALMTKKAQETPLNRLGATGYGVRLLVDFLRKWQS